MKWIIGCSGFHYKEWKGVFYPDKIPQRQWFEYYSSMFHSLELNVTFYRFPQLSFLQNWYQKSPDDFEFAVKAPRLITHYKQFNDSAQLLSDFYRIIKEGLQDKLGPVLFQMPPKMEYSKEKLEQIIGSMDKDFLNVVEFRHSSWWNVEVYTQLSKHKITFCGMSYPGLPDEAIATTPNVYYRFHGVPRLYYSEYDHSALERVADQIAPSKVKSAYIFFNNTAAVSAINNALYLRHYCDQLQ